MKRKFGWYALVVTILASTFSWGSLFSAPSSGSGSSWSSNTRGGGGGWGGGYSGGHK